MTTNLSRSIVRGFRWPLTVLALAACGERRENARAEPVISAASDVKAVSLSGSRNLRESSGIAASRQLDAWFSVDDSGNDPRLYAFDTTGADRGTWRIRGAQNVDWEAIAVGPCAAAVPASGFDGCVYVGDVGDNAGRQPFRAIYRVAQPTAKGGDETLQALSRTFVYPDGAHDVEAMYVAANLDVFLITKRPLTAGGSRLRPALVYSVRAPTPGDTARATAALVDSLPIVPGSEPLMMITDAALSPDGKYLAVRTYVQVYIFATDATTGRVNHAVAPTICDVTPLGEPQGEGVAWVNAAGRLAFMSEGKKQPLRLASCPLPHGQ